MAINIAVYRQHFIGWESNFYSMRRLIVEMPSKGLSKLIPESSFKKVKSGEVLHFLRFDYHEVDMILRVEYNEPNVNIEDLFGEYLIEAKLLEQEKGREGESYTYFVKVRSVEAIHGGPDLKAVGGYVSLPYEVRDGKVKITFLGSAKQVRVFLKRVEDAGVRYRMISLTDAQFSPHSPLSRLTEKQRRVLITAHNLGYYNVPRKINLVQLAERLGLAYSTVDVQLRRAERRLLNHIMNKS
jgi:predicted DNA binding protein